MTLFHISVGVQPPRHAQQQCLSAPVDHGLAQAVRVPVDLGNDALMQSRIRGNFLLLGI